MNAWKCVYCSNFASYMMEGNSVCEEHYLELTINLGIEAREKNNGKV